MHDSEIEILSFQLLNKPSSSTDKDNLMLLLVSARSIQRNANGTVFDATLQTTLLLLMYKQFFVIDIH